jgi:hypothetical protein
VTQKVTRVTGMVSYILGSVTASIFSSNGWWWLLLCLACIAGATATAACLVCMGCAVECYNAHEVGLAAGQLVHWMP